MAAPEITVSVGGGRELDRAGLAAFVASLPGLRLIPIDKTPPAQVLIWFMGQETNELPSIHSNTALLLITDHADYASLPETVTGLFSRGEAPAALGTAIRQVASGEQYLSPSLATVILQKRQQESGFLGRESSVTDSLTDREREILSLLAQGLSNKMIAAQLYLSVRTVEGHLVSIYERLGVHSRTEAMLVAVTIR